MLLGGVFLFLLFDVYRITALENVLNLTETWSGDREGAYEVLEAAKSTSSLPVASIVLLFAVTIGARVWMSQMVQTVMATGNDPAVLKRHWAYVTWRVGVTLSALLLLIMAFTGTSTWTVSSLPDARDVMISVEHRQLLIVWINIGYAVLVGTTVVALYQRLHRLTSTAS